MSDDRGAADWFVIDISVEEHEVDELSGALWAAGAAGIEERPAGSLTRLVVSVLPERVDAVETALGDRRRQRRRVDVDAGLDDWRPWATPTRVGRVVIEPAWRGQDAEPSSTSGAVVLRIDPGHAFGSGAHVTTRLALELLQMCLRSGMSVLDVGTGSGVLAIAAARLGASRVAAIDLAGEAIRAARANARLNRVEGIVEVVDRALHELHDQFDIVVANLDRPTLVSLGQDLLRRAQPAGLLVVSGFLTTSESDLAAAFRGMQWKQVVREGDWSAVLGEVDVSAGP